MEYGPLLLQINTYLQERIKNGSCEFCFHNFQHTQDVVESVEELANHYALNDQDRFVVLAAAYFHDIGYESGGSEGHEARSAEIAMEFLAGLGVSNEKQDQVKGCILATKMPQAPRNLLEQIVCDADLFHLGKLSFDERNKLMLQEAEQLKGEKIDRNIWREQTIELLQKHVYHTKYAQEKLALGKRDNLQGLMKKQKKTLEKQEAALEAERLKKPERGIETMFRITSANSQRLSDMADNKSNILLTVNSIILSIVVAVLVKALDNNPHLIIPTVILMSCSVVTMVLAILATIPKIPNGKYQPEDVKTKSVNLLFFGNFYKTSFKDYEEAMKKAMDDKEFLYGMLTKDVHSQGVVLGRKYRLLRYAYGVFMFGLILSVIAFSIAIFITK